MARDPRHTTPHRRARATALAALVDGDPCPLCNEPMTHDQALDLDHATPVALGGLAGTGRLAHASCNRRAGQALGQALRAGRAVDAQAVEWAVDRTARDLAAARKKALARPAATW